jgi:hypothetical protein
MRKRGKPKIHSTNPLERLNGEINTFEDASSAALSSMGFVPENQVRTGLPAGGRRIRTFGPPQDSRLLETALFACAAGMTGSSRGGLAVRIPFCSQRRVRCELDLGKAASPMRLPPHLPKSWTPFDRVSLHRSGSITRRCANWNRRSKRIYGYGGCAAGFGLFPPGVRALAFYRVPEREF